MPKLKTLLQKHRADFVQWFVQIAVVFVVAATSVPGVNESHYLTKAKHFFDPSFAPGDLFLESGNSHYASTLLAGSLSLFMPLGAVAWVGRCMAWGLLSFAWIRFGQSLRIPRVLAPFVLATWILAVDYGNWAGEWAVGGFEGKSLSYPCVLLGIAAVLQDRWERGWVWLACGVLWHPLVGGWAGLSVGLLWLFSRSAPGFFSQMKWIAVAFAISLLGILPALFGIRGDDPSAIAAQVHVFFRLDHHLRPTTFSETRNWAACVSVTLFLIVAAAWIAAKHFAVSRGNPKGEADEEELRLSLQGSGRLIAIATFAALFAFIGWCIDHYIADSKAATHQPVLAASLLRFYWLRWADIAVPLAWSAVLWQGVGFGFYRISEANGHADDENRVLLARARKVGIALLAPTVLCLSAFRNYQGSDDTVPPADKLVVETFGERRKIEWTDGRSNRYIDWLAVCEWIREKTPTDSLWLTPKYQQSFKWHAERAEVVCWKDVPQDVSSVIEWYRRVKVLTPRVTPSGLVRGWTDEEIIELKEEFGFEYVLIDRTYHAKHEQPPGFELVYPINVVNRSFAVFRIR